MFKNICLNCLSAVVFLSVFATMSPSVSMDEEKVQTHPTVSSDPKKEIPQPSKVYKRRDTHGFLMEGVRLENSGEMARWFGTSMTITPQTSSSPSFITYYSPVTFMVESGLVCVPTNNVQVIFPQNFKKKK
jgi:hypothetical protein